MSKVSIVIPTYNRASTVCQAIDSALSQSYLDCEIIVVDDGSTDDTEMRLIPYRDRIQYVYQENQERSVARNRGAELAGGEFLLFLDSDDLMYPDQVQLLLDVFEQKTGIGLVGGGWEEVDELGRFLVVRRPWEDHPKLNLEMLLFICPLLPSATLIRRRWLEKVGGFDAELPPVEDADLWIRLAQAGCRMDWLETPVCQYRISAGDSADNTCRRGRALVKSLDNFFSQPRLDVRWLSLRRQVMGHAHLRIVSFTLAAGLHDGLGEDLICAIAHDPVLAEDRFELLFKTIVNATAHSRVVKDPARFLAEVFADLPDELIALRRRRREAQANAMMARSFLLAQAKDWPRARQSFAHSILLSPSSVSSRGVLSLFGESVLGPRLMGLIREVL